MSLKVVSDEQQNFQLKNMVETTVSRTQPVASTVRRKSQKPQKSKPKNPPWLVPAQQEPLSNPLSHHPPFLRLGFGRTFNFSGSNFLFRSSRWVALDKVYRVRSSGSSGSGSSTSNGSPSSRLLSSVDFIGDLLHRCLRGEATKGWRQLRNKQPHPEVWGSWPETAEVVVSCRRRRGQYQQLPCLQLKLVSFWKFSCHQMASYNGMDYDGLQHAMQAGHVLLHSGHHLQPQQQQLQQQQHINHGDVGLNEVPFYLIKLMKLPITVLWFNSLFSLLKRLYSICRIMICLVRFTLRSNSYSLEYTRTLKTEI